MPEPAREYAKRIAEASQRMDALINDLLDYSRLARAEVDVQPVALEGLVDGLLRDMKEEVARRRVAVVVERPLPSVYGHRLILAQVLANLLSNAIKFVAPGVDPRVVVRGEESGRRARIWVEDNGIGIAPEHQSRIFRVFERLHATDAYPGTGVGLAIVRKGIQRMGGRVGVESAVGAGSRFWFELARA
jgi:signal transduction histidine kinase